MSLIYGDCRSSNLEKLSNVLNTIHAKVQKYQKCKDSFWAKIADLVSRIFGGGIEKEISKCLYQLNSRVFSLESDSLLSKEEIEMDTQEFLLKNEALFNALVKAFRIIGNPIIEHQTTSWLPTTYDVKTDSALESLLDQKDKYFESRGFVKVNIGKISSDEGISSLRDRILKVFKGDNYSLPSGGWERNVEGINTLSMEYTAKGQKFIIKLDLLTGDAFVKEI